MGSNCLTNRQLRTAIELCGLIKVMNMQKLNRQTLTEVLNVCCFSHGDKGMGLPLLIMGEPGEGKSDVVEQTADYYALPFVALPPGEMGDGAFGVVPVPIQHEGEMILKFPRPEFFQPFEVGRGLLFLDELTTAPRSIKAAMLSAIWSRRIGGHYFGKGVRVIAAANPHEIAAEGRPLSIPEANRLIHTEIGTIPNDIWIDYHGKALTGKSQEDDGEADNRRMKMETRFKEGWANGYGKTLVKVAAFRSANLGHMHARPQTSSGKGSGPWPSSRSWSNALRALAGAEVLKVSTEAKEALLEGCIGSAASSEYFAFSSKMDLPNAADVLDGKTDWKPSKGRLDIVLAVFRSCLFLLAEPMDAKTRARRKDAYCELLLKNHDSMKEVVVSMTKDLATMCSERAKDLPGIESEANEKSPYRQIINKVSQSIRLMGVA